MNLFLNIEIAKAKVVQAIKHQFKVINQRLIIEIFQLN
jgi:hypothetical protein